MAAGQGKRLNHNHGRIPKTLIEIGGRTLLERIVFGLDEIEFDRISIIVGEYKSAFDREIAKYPNNLKSRIQLIENKKFISYGSFYSLLLGLKNVSSRGVWAFDSDIIFEAELLRRIKYHDEDISALCSTSLTQNSDKVIVFKELQRVIKIGKNLDLTSTSGIIKREYMGVFFLNFHAQNFFKSIQGINLTLDYEAVINLFLDKIELDDIFLNNMRWNEIDTLEDLIHAKANWK